MIKHKTLVYLGQHIGFCMVAHRAAAHCWASYFQNEIFYLIIYLLFYLQFKVIYYNITA